MDIVTLVTIIGGLVTIAGFIYVVLFGQKSLPELWAESRERRRSRVPAATPAPSAATVPDDLSGRTLGTYQIVARIGQGGMGTVYKAFQPSMDRHVAIKVLPAHLARDPQFIQRFQREARAIARLEHPHILPAYDFGEQDGIVYIAMRFVEGGSLKERLAHGPLPLAELEALVRQVGGALDCAHQMGVIHRDLKPGNILLDTRGQAFLADFGLAHLSAPGQQASSGHTVVGTPTYMAPEQGLGLRADQRSDLYALGVVMYEMATGRVPYEAETPVGVIYKHIHAPLPSPRLLRPELPERLEQVILTAMAKSPDSRYQGAAELVAALETSAPADGDRAALTDSAEHAASPAKPHDPLTILVPQVFDLPEALLRTPPAELPPFVVGPPVAHPGRFFGREREVRRLFGLLRRPPLQNAAIIGPRRSGKTSLLRYLKTVTRAAPQALRPGQRADWLEQPERYRWIFIDFQDPRLGTREALLRYLLLGLSLPAPEPCDLERFLSVVRRGLAEPTVILLDEIGVALQRCPELDNAFWEGLRSLATNQADGRLAFVLSSHAAPDELARQSGLGSPFFNIFGYTCSLGPLTEAEARELVLSSPQQFPPEDTAWILEHSGRWPILLQVLCRERLAVLEEGDPDADWRTEGLRQMAPFRHLLEAQA